MLGKLLLVVANIPVNTEDAAGSILFRGSLRCKASPHDNVIKPMLPLINQLPIKPLERENIAEVFFRPIRKTNIYSVPAFVKADSTTRLSFDD